MNLPSRYGSSEYSARAEELFALFVRRRAAGEELDFEAFCAEHPEHADELDGLHADWDNLHGLLGRMGVLGHLAEAGEDLPSPGPAGPFVDGAPTPALSARTAQGPSGMRAGVLLGVLLAAACAAGALGLLARREARAAELLAEHNRRLESEIFELDGRLIGLEESRLEAAERAKESERREQRLAELAAEEARRAADLRRLADAHAERAAEKERLAEERARAAEDEALRAAAQARIAEAEARRADEQGRRAADLERDAHLERRRAAAALVALASARLERGDLESAGRVLEGVDPDRRNFAWRHLAARLADAPRDARGSRGQAPRPAAFLGGEAEALLDALGGELHEPSPTPEGPAMVRASGRSEDGSLALLALSDGRILGVVPADRGGEPPSTLELHRGAPGTVGLTLTGGGRLLVLVGEDGSLRAVDLDLGSERWSVAGVVPGAPLVSATGLVAARLGPGTVGAWRLSDGLFLGSLVGSGRTLRDYGWTETGELILGFTDGTACSGPPGASSAPLPCPADRLGALGIPLTLAPEGVRGVDSPCGELRAERSGESLVLRDLACGAPILEFPLPTPLTGLAFSADGRHLMALLESGLAWVWSTEPAAVRALWLPPAVGPDRALR